MRHTIKQVREKVHYINKLLNRPTEYAVQVANGGFRINIGHLSVDYNPIYGGCQINETTNIHGGVTDQVFGLSWGHRLKLAEMSLFLDGVIAGLEYNK